MCVSEREKESLKDLPLECLVSVIKALVKKRVEGVDNLKTHSKNYKETRQA
uniref:Uncharacterized protein n=1 Tax=Rhizophora mucronata TaxID=61149 RepID=A0A2P2PL91_RHIMU